MIIGDYDISDWQVGDVEHRNVIVKSKKGKPTYSFSDQHYLHRIEIYPVIVYEDTGVQWKDGKQAWCVYFTSGDQLAEIYNNMYPDSGESECYSSSKEAKDKVDSFLDKLKKLKAFT